MNVLHINDFYYSGQTAHAFALVREQQAQGMHSSLVMEGAPSYQTLTLYQDTLEKLGAKLIRHGDLTGLMEHLRGKQIQLIHAHSANTFPLAASVAQQSGIPLVLTCHGLGFGQQDFRPFLREAAALVCVSQRVANSVREFKEKTHIIPNGINAGEFVPEAKEEPVKITLISRVDPKKAKGFNQFCKAVDLLEGVQFFVVANKNPESKTAQYLGWINKPAELLIKTDIVAGSGRAVIEGMAAGNAAIVLGRTYQGIITPETVAKKAYPDVSGLSGSDPCYRNIFYDLAKLVQNRLYLQQLQSFSRDLVEREFDMKVVSQRITAIYQKALLPGK